MREFELEVGSDFLEIMKAKRSKSPGEVVMVIRRPGGKVLLMTKPFYPPGIYRLPSGQIMGDESPDQAFVRELEEETGILGVPCKRLDDLRFVFKYADNRLDYFSYVYVTDETVRKPEPKDTEEAITGFIEISVCDLTNIAESLTNLSGPWHDWGRFRAIPHRIAFEHLCLGK
ncbi:MAG: NUDIX hydrolase [Armatimonadetes bacterium]|nr:NUDIX hydrolase [Armatimonadota bacterium]